MTKSRQNDRRAEIRDAAKKCFLETGYLATSMDTVMDAAGIASRETLYRYYRTKDELFVDVIESLTVERGDFGKILASYAAPVDLSGFRDLFVKLATDILDTMLQPDYLSLMRTVIADLRRFPQLGAMFLQTVPARAMAYVRRALDDAKTAGIIRTDSKSETVARLFLGALLTYAIFDGLLRGSRGPVVPAKKEIKAIVDSIVNGVSSRAGEPN